MTNDYSNSDSLSSTRIKIFYSIVILIFVAFIVQLINLQIVKGVLYKEASHAQAIKKVRQEPFRGNIFDSEGDLIVHNESSFSLTLTPNLWKEQSTHLLTSILDLDSTELSNKLKKYSNYSPFVPVKIQRDIGIEIISGIEEYNDYLPGIDVTVESKRLYKTTASMSHILGYTREISPNELDKYQFYNPGDAIGKNGLEKEYEVLLRGREGVKLIAVNKFGQRVSNFEEGEKDKQSKNGFNLFLGINSKMQRKAEELLKGKRGAIVAINPNNGEVITMASSPNYNLKEFSGRISPKYYDSLITDEDKPLLDRAVNSHYPPGSSWKMLIAVAGLEEGLIDKNTTLYCKGGYQYGNRFFKCLGYHGNINVTNAIKKSCNAFFYQLSLKLGIENVVNYANKFNFGNKTGIDLPSEANGNFPSLEKLNEQYNDNIPGWKLLNWGIGQGDITVTPLQMASYIATIANKGTWFQPHIVRKIYNNETEKFENIEFDIKDLNINPQSMEIVKEGMWDVVNSPGGTGGRARIDGLDVCGKTSTAQNPHGKDHGWFTCFAPKENPQIALAVFVENSGWGGTVCAPIAKEFLLEYFYPERTNPQDIQLDTNNTGQDSTEIVSE